VLSPAVKFRMVFLLIFSAFLIVFLTFNDIIRVVTNVLLKHQGFNR